MIIQSPIYFHVINKQAPTLFTSFTFTIILHDAFQMLSLTFSDTQTPLTLRTTHQENYLIAVKLEGNPEKLEGRSLVMTAWR